MKRIRLDRLSTQFLSPAPARPTSHSTNTRICRTTRTSKLHTPLCSQTRRWQTTQAVALDADLEDDHITIPEEERSLPPLPSPPPERAVDSAKLAALHARLSLSSKIPLQTLARALIDPSADAHPRFNNANLAFVGASLLNYHTSEFLVTRFPRLPMAILFAAMRGYAGVFPLHQVARGWGVEEAAAPGEEVDPGLLQFNRDKPSVAMNSWGYVRAESRELLKYKWRRGLSSSVIYDDPFGQIVTKEEDEPIELEVSDARNKKDLVLDDPLKNAHANFVRAVVGAIYLYCGRDTTKTFVKSHVLSRKLDIENLFLFKLPTRELARLCAREDFEPPVARLLSETGRASRTPVYVVGIFSGHDKLGEGTGPNLDAARTAAAINTLKSWYLYSPGNVGVPSDTFAEDAAPWKPSYVDIGEIIS
ncbi:54S ribosomal protein L3 [Hypoxylon trugodes]|uniref:54S ribosomal protein L3 n=1 Tax=Hypoxylon trugodes TaxID=326681 RepID=UPI00218E3B35|nr:54S ribosomal protein L3 [Hypoxylon trugodes]KAI1386398.1 54S ribosomal protein L3 [Hypoxylon trugodes]